MMKLNTKVHKIQQDLNLAINFFLDGSGKFKQVSTLEIFKLTLLLNGIEGVF